MFNSLAKDGRAENLPKNNTLRVRLCNIQFVFIMQEQGLFGCLLMPLLLPVALDSLLLLLFCVVISLKKWLLLVMKPVGLLQIKNTS